MKAYFHKVPIELQTSFSIRHNTKSNFGTLWHYHPELELNFIVKGEGVRFVGDNISNFSAGDLVLLGEKLPHTWRCKEEYFQHNPDLEAEAIVIHFASDCLGKDLMKLPEAYLIPKLFEKAKKGMVFSGETKEKLIELLHAAINSTMLDSLIILLSILKIMAESTEFTPIASAHAFYPSNESDMIRLNKVCTYTLTNYKHEITLEEIASISNLSITSFCRYFKLMTKKTFSDFLIEIRISHACRFLIEDRLPTEVLSSECGFNNISNFYRHFKKITGMTPLEYKRKYLNNGALMAS